VTNDELMGEAIRLAHEAEGLGEVPIGCVVWHGPSRRIIGRGFNRRILDHDPSGHAEIVAMRGAGRELGAWRLLECTLAVTLEPCPMCAGAIVNARVPKLVYGCDDPKGGAVRTLYQLCGDVRLNHQVEVVAGVRAVECAGLLTEFFRKQRALGKK
jgi:tRNA(adenine34) deaminase